MGDRVTVLALGIRGHQPTDPTDPEQPSLVDGNHLRWMPDDELGFPWHGFYLFRRESQPESHLCLSAELHRVHSGASKNVSLATRLGRLSSPKPLVFTDDFAPAGVVEADLDAPLRFDLPRGVEAGQVEVRIGSRAAPPPSLVRQSFEQSPVGQRPNPIVEHGVRFEVRDQKGAPRPFASIEKRIQIWPGLVAQHQVEIRLPIAATTVKIQFSRGLRDPAVHVRAFNQDGTLAQQLELHVGLVWAEGATLTGSAITRILVDAPGPNALLHYIEFDGDGPHEDPIAIEVRALAGATLVDRAVVRPGGGQIASASLAGKGITAVEVDAGRAALVDLCYVPSLRPLNFGWSELTRFSYPLCLPVAHADYPCPGKPADTNAAQALAFSRVTYPAPQGWNQGFPELHDELVLLVEGGPTPTPMAQRTHPDLKGQPLSPSTEETPTLPSLRPLELVLLASLQPALAQMLGLYFVDRSALPNVGYDYLLLADSTGVLGGTAETALDWIAFIGDETKIDAAVAFDCRSIPRPPIAPPLAPHAYALPGMATRAIDGAAPIETAGNVGLWWPLPADTAGDHADPDQIIFYLPKRADLGVVKPTAQPAPSQYQKLPALPPVLVSEPDPSDPPPDPNSRSSDWPPPSIALHVVDADLVEGWYSYRVSGQDVFGRRSALSLPAQWYQWAPPADTPAPWYYQPSPGGHQPIHAFAVALLDKVPPRAPLGVEAWALDPADHWVLKDSLYKAWRDDHPSLVGLRVRWRWTLMQQIQAPDTNEFRIYYQPGRWNVRLGTIEKVAVASATESDVELDFADSHQADAFVDARLRVGNDDFAIVGSQPGAKLGLRVKNIGAGDTVQPAEGHACSVVIPEQNALGDPHALWIDTSLPTSWTKRLFVVPYGSVTRTVVDPSKDGHGIPLSDVTFVEAGLNAQLTVTGATAQLPTDADLSSVQPWIDHLWVHDAAGAEQLLRIKSCSITAQTVTLESAPTVGTPVAWILGRPTREYEVFLPAEDVGQGNPFEPSLAEPTVFAQIAVSAVDDKTHTQDDPKWGPAPLGNRFGNESRVSPSATIFRVWRQLPDPPALPQLPERLVATKADYHNRSYTTFRFNDPQQPLRVHILRALDESLFQRDWLIRETLKTLDATNPEHDDYFPDDMNAADRQAAVAAIKAIASEADYATLLEAAWPVLALLPGNEGAAGSGLAIDKPSLKKRDWPVRRTHSGFAETFADLFPTYWSSATRAAAADPVNKISGPAAYVALSDNALRLLAALPGNEAAFTQVTLHPLDMADSEIKDQRRPDDEATYTPSTALRAYLDTLPGNATNRYFYRASFVDGAQNQGALSLPGPPVYLPAVEPPRTPVITSILGGERKITIAWAMNREHDLADYRVYRTDDVEPAQDVRSMALIKTLAQNDIDAGNAHPEWTDRDVIAGRRYFYRLTAANTSGNESSPTPVHVGVAVDTRVPPPPEWTEQTWHLRRRADGVLIDWPTDGIVPAGHAPVLRLGWRCEIPGSEFVVRRWSEADRVWKSPDHVTIQPSAAVAFAFSLLDDDVSPALPTIYRLRFRSSGGVWSAEDAVLAIRPPRPKTP